MKINMPLIAIFVIALVLVTRGSSQEVKAFDKTATVTFDQFHKQTTESIYKKYMVACEPFEHRRQLRQKMFVGLFTERIQKSSWYQDSKPHRDLFAKWLATFSDKDYLDHIAVEDSPEFAELKKSVAFEHYANAMKWSQQQFLDDTKHLWYVYRDDMNKALSGVTFVKK